MTARSRTLFAILGVVILTTSGCASYRVSSNVDAPASPAPSASAPPTSAAAPTATPVLLALDNLPGRTYRLIGPVEVTVKKLTVFHKDPTKEQANEALIERARAVGADAVINIRYDSGIGWLTWGYMEAKGQAVKLTD